MYLVGCFVNKVYEVHFYIGAENVVCLWILFIFGFDVKSTCKSVHLVGCVHVNLDVLTDYHD